MSQLLLFASQNRDLNAILSREEKELIQRNKNLIALLSKFIPTTHEEIEYIKGKLEEYRNVQTELKKQVPEELICKLKLPPRLDLPKGYAKLLKYKRRNENKVKELEELESRGLLGVTQRAKETMICYQNNRAWFKYNYPNEPIKTFTPKQTIQKCSQESCVICGFPITSMLTKHHVIPVSKGGRSKGTVKLCPTCHYTLHKCVDMKQIPEEVKDYYGSFEMLEKLEELVTVAMTA